MRRLLLLNGGIGSSPAEQVLPEWWRILRARSMPAAWPGMVVWLHSWCAENPASMPRASSSTCTLSS
jgi:hypothetical protein